MRSTPAPFGVHLCAIKASAVGAARRHSLRVRVTKVSLIGLTFVAALLVAADAKRGLRRIESFAPKAQVTIAGTKIVLKSPAIWGALKDGSKFEVKADIAQEDIGNDNLMELFQVVVKITKPGNSTVHANASYGLFNRRKGIVSLDGDISVENAEGNMVTCKSAVVDLDKGAIKSLDLGPGGPDELRSAAMMAFAKQR